MTFLTNNPNAMSSWKKFLQKIFIQDLDYGRNIPTTSEILGSNPHCVRISPRMTISMFKLNLKATNQPPKSPANKRKCPSPRPPHENHYWR
jgi:hypothetical protein